MRMSGGCRAIWRRSSAGVSPVRLATVMLRHRLAEPLRRQGDPGQRRPQVALDVVGQRLERRDVQDRTGRAPRASGAGLGWVASRSRHQRNAARVLPLPVGAWMSVCRPLEIAAQPRAWASVGASKLARNQSRTAGENGASGSGTAGGGHGARSIARDGQFRPDVRLRVTSMVPARKRAEWPGRRAAWPLLCAGAGLE